MEKTNKAQMIEGNWQKQTGFFVPYQCGDGFPVTIDKNLTIISLRIRTLDSPICIESAYLLPYHDTQSEVSMSMTRAYACAFAHH